MTITKQTYPRLVRRAMIDGVIIPVMKVLKEITPQDLSPDERPEIYITLNTKVESLGMPDALRKKYPDSITIVLQHNYKITSVDKAGFELVVSFSGVPVTITVPWRAMLGFHDVRNDFSHRLGVCNIALEKPRETPGKIVSIEDFRKP